MLLLLLRMAKAAAAAVVVVGVPRAGRGGDESLKVVVGLRCRCRCRRRRRQELLPRDLQQARQARGGRQLQGVGLEGVEGGHVVKDATADSSADAAVSRGRRGGGSTVRVVAAGRSSSIGPADGRSHVARVGTVASRLTAGGSNVHSLQALCGPLEAPGARDRHD